MLVHKTARDAFLKRFAELESIIMNPVDYAKAVLAIGNSEHIEALDQRLSWLPNTAVMSVTVALSASSNASLNKHEYEVVERACHEIIFLEDCRLKLLDFLERMMHIIAPNTAAIVGASVCAKLISSAGGIVELSRTPACNIQVLGSQKKALHGFSTASASLHRGHIGEVEMVTKAPQSDQIKIVRMLSTKTALAARVDACKTHPSGD